MKENNKKFELDLIFLKLHCLNMSIRHYNQNGYYKKFLKKIQMFIIINLQMTEYKQQVIVKTYYTFNLLLIEL